MSAKVEYEKNGKAKTTWFLNGRPVSLKEFRRKKLPRLPAGSGCFRSAYGDDRPGKSIAMGCHSSEIEMMNARVKQEGIVGVEYVPHRNRHGEVIGGDCLITNNSTRTGRRKWMKVYGQMTGGAPLRDADACYD